MNTTTRLSDEEYEALSLEYEQKPPELSSTPGFLTICANNTLYASVRHRPIHLGGEVGHKVFDRAFRNSAI